MEVDLYRKAEYIESHRDTGQRLKGVQRKELKQQRRAVEENQKADIDLRLRFGHANHPNSVVQRAHQAEARAHCRGERAEEFVAAGVFPAATVGENDAAGHCAGIGAIVSVLHFYSVCGGRSGQ
jgi:hypothetical protein